MADSAGAKYKSRSCTIPVLLVVFLQTLTVCITLVAIPLSFVFYNLKYSNQLSTSSGLAAANALATKIQNNEGEIALSNLESRISTIQNIVMDMQLLMSNYVDQTNPQMILNNLAYVQKYQNYFGNIYYGNPQDAFIGLTSTVAPNQINVNLPLNVNNPSCAVCEFWKTLSPSDLSLASKSSNLSWASWDIQTQTVTSAYKSMNTPFAPTKRSWYLQAASSKTVTPTVQWTNPYVFVRNIPGATANVPLYDVSGKMVGVAAADIPFGPIQNSLSSYLQTTNAFMFIFSPDGTLVANSKNENLVTPDGKLKTILNLSDPTMLDCATYLSGLIGKTQDFKSLGPLSTYNYNGMYLQVRVMESAPYWAIVNGAPITDYTSGINDIFSALQTTLETNVGTIIQLTTAIFLVVVVVSCFLMYFSMARPLRVLTDIMRQATDFDFTAFENFKQRGNFIEELNVMESTFSLMLEKFAGAIQSNKAITGARGPTKPSSVDSSKPPSSSNTAASESTMPAEKVA
ncbi:hypothetical protein BDR26DRAFT_866874 [Obelidium mucronatum]|nr:hypothetical protein BDR26DRAFT_866874 [Obelidium mucronatum]